MATLVAAAGRVRDLFPASTFFKHPLGRRKIAESFADKAGTKMVHTLAHRKRREPSLEYRFGVVVRTVMVVATVSAFIHSRVLAQMALPNNVHYRHHVVDRAPGEIGQQQLTRGGPLRGYFQPVQILGPEGLKVSFAVGGQFERPQAVPHTGGMLIGQVYRLRVTEIPGHEGMEVFPTVEVIDRLYPPEGKKWRFPIPIELTRKELEYAMAGRFVTRVIYLEDAERALPLPELPGFQRYFEVAREQDPLEVADQLGRPMAILRMGSRTPDYTGPDATFLFGCPPVAPAPQPVSNPAVRAVPGNTGLEEVSPQPLIPRLETR